MSPRVRAVAVAVAALAFVVLVAVVARDVGEDSAATVPFGATVPAAEPFGGFDETSVAVGDDCLRVLVATTTPQRVQGLRAVESLDPYDGMLFAYRADVSARFTMADTLIPLDITFFAADGRPVGSERMVPCPDTQDECPTYGADEKFRYALEVPAGAGGAGALGSC